LEKFTSSVHGIDKKHDEISKEEWKFPTSEVSFLSPLLSLHMQKAALHLSKEGERLTRYPRRMGGHF